MIVVDASVLVPALVDDGAAGDLARARLLPEVLTAPELVDLEVTSVLRSLVRSGQVSADRARRAIDDLVALPLERASHRAVVQRCWYLRDKLTAYDAAYVALAELLGVALVTADRRLGRAPGVRCQVELLPAE